MKRLTILTLLVVILAMTVTPVFAQGGQTVIGQSVTVDATHPVEGDLLVIGGSVTVTPEGRVEGDLVVWGGNVEVAGHIAGDVVAWGGEVTLRSSAVVEGNVFLAGGRLHREEEAVIGGDVMNRVSPGGFHFFRSGAFPWTFPPVVTVRGQPYNGSTFLSFIVNLIRIGFTAAGAAVVGLLVMIFLPEQTQVVKTVAAEQPVASMGVGLLTLIVLPLLMVLLILTVCGIPVAAVLALASLMAGLYGWIALGLMVGERLLSLLEPEKPLPLIAVVVGVLLISVLSAVPCLGWLLGLVGGLWGLGAVVLSRGGSRGTPSWGDRWAPAPASPALPTEPDEV